MCTCLKGVDSEYVLSFYQIKLDFEIRVRTLLYTNTQILNQNDKKNEVFGALSSTYLQNIEFQSY